MIRFHMLTSIALLLLLVTEPVQAETITIDTKQVNSKPWSAAIKKIKKKWGGQQITVLRVLVAGDSVQNAYPKIQLKSNKLNRIDTFPQAGGTFRVVKPGEFVIVEHINSPRRKAGKDPVWIGSLKYNHVKIWVPVPSGKEINILGDVVLSRTTEDSYGQIAIQVKHQPEQSIQLKSCRIGSVVVGGFFGKSLSFNNEGICYLNELSPGSYKLLLSDFDTRKSRWDIAVKPGMMTLLTFTARSQTIVELSNRSFGKYAPMLNGEPDNLKSLFPAPSKKDHQEPPAKTTQTKPKQVTLTKVSKLKPIDRPDDKGFTKLHYEAMRGNVKKAEILLEQGANVDIKQRTFFGAPLQYAASAGHVEMVRLLLEHKANVNSTDRFLRTPLMWAASHGHCDVLKVLLSSGANHRKTKNGSNWTALHFAADKGELKAAQILIDAGADLSALNSDGETPLDMNPSIVSGKD